MIGPKESMMTDLETYTRWLAYYEAMDTRCVRGEVSGDYFDCAIWDMEERLGVNKWSVLRWHRAQNAWYKANVEEGA